MATMYFTELSSGAPALTLVNGSLAAILDYFLPMNGWAVEFTSGFKRIYRAGAGNRLRLQLDDDSAESGNVQVCYARGCEGATGVSAVTDPFPTVAQVANGFCNWAKGASSASPGSPRKYVLIVTPTCFWFAARGDHATDDRWDGGIFGEVPARNAEDVWATIINTRNLSGVSGNSSSPSTYPAFETDQVSSGVLANYSAPEYWWARDITGAVKSTKAMIHASGAKIGNVNGLPAARAGYANRAEREKIGFHDTGTNTTGVLGIGAMVRRAWWPNMWGFLHAGIGALSSVNEFTDTGYDPAANFRVLPGYSSTNFIVETTDTWSIPSP